MPRCKPGQGYEGGADADTYALESRLKVRRATLGMGEGWNGYVSPAVTGTTAASSTAT